MLRSGLDLFRRSSRLLAGGRANAQPSRKIATEGLDPYPYDYINNKKWPSQHNYRETWSEPPWLTRQNTVGIWLMRVFWTYIFTMTFYDPGAIYGHFVSPDPSIFTDEQLGIPPDEEGLYEDWLRQREATSDQLERSDKLQKQQAWGILFKN